VLSSPATTNPKPGNHLIQALPKDDSRKLLEVAERVSTPRGCDVYHHNGTLSHVYFPLDAIFSYIVPLKDGKRVEAATVGNEGMLGVSLILGMDSAPVVAISQVPGQALRIAAADFLELSKVADSLDRTLRRYAAYSLRSAYQTGACNMVHSVEERACRWLLMTHDRAGEDEFLLTHEFLAEMLGARRQTVSIVAGALQRAGMITYSRGLVRVLDRHALESASCECYQAVRREYDRIVLGKNALWPRNATE
jgi:CRP-like cAMP-binding protein